MSVYLSIRDFGAVGDGITNDTIAIQNAIDEGARTGRTVYIDPGRYSVGELFLHPGSSIKSEAQWGFQYDHIGNAVLVQRYMDQRSLLNISHANGATITGLSLTGEGREGGCHGILCDREKFDKVEDAFRIEKCRVAAFSGHGVYLNRVWCFTARQNMFCRSGGDGLRIFGCDGFVSDNWFSGNRGAGFGGEGDTCAMTLTGNRIEWNHTAGISIEGSSHYNITGNYIDRAGGPGIRITGAHFTHKGIPEDYRTSNTIACTGNIIFRSGKFAENKDDSCHVYLNGCAGVSFIGNSMCIGRDDRGDGQFAPSTAMILENLTDSVISGNTMFVGALDNLIIDRGNHMNAIIKDNVGSLFPKEAVRAEDERLAGDIVVNYRPELKEQIKKSNTVIYKNRK